MGRLIRKKATAKPKKKKTAEESQQPSSPAGKEPVKKPLFSMARTPDSGSRSAASAQTAVSSYRGGLGKDNFITKGLQFLREVKIELKKVTWPSRKQALGSTAVVIVLVIVISLFLGVVDVSLSSLIRLVIK